MNQNSALFLLGLSFGASVGVVAGVLLCDYVRDDFNKQVRLSERKTCTQTIDERTESFIREAVPQIGLKRGTREYDFAENICINGVYDHNKSQGELSTKDVVAAFNACGWTIQYK